MPLDQYRETRMSPGILLDSRQIAEYRIEHLERHSGMLGESQAPVYYWLINNSNPDAAELHTTSSADSLHTT